MLAFNARKLFALTNFFVFLFCNYWVVFTCASVFLVLQRITIPEILEDEWFKKDYKPPVFEEKEDTNLDDVEAVFKDSEVS